MPKVAVLIPTRNRPAKIVKLLESLTSSTIRPNQVIIVASGRDIAHDLKQFEGIFEITYHFTDSKGQITQKKIGLTLLDKENDWCLFLDDDLVVKPQAIENALEAVHSRVDQFVVGVGFSLPITSRAHDANPFMLVVGNLFGIQTKQPGRVLRNGHAISYMQSRNIVETEWLNGASMWRIEVLDTYALGMPSTNYAACEDLIFSYPLRGKGKLIYAPDAQLDFQEDELSDFNSLNVFESASYWRYYFVCQNNLSRLAFFYSQFGRLSFIVMRTKKGKLTVFRKLIKSQIPLIISFLRGKPHQLILQDFASK